MVLRAAGLLLRRLPCLLQHILNLVVTVGSKNVVQTAFVCTNVVLLSISTRKLQRARFVASVRVMRELDEESLRHLLHADLPKWVKFADWERGQHLQSFVALAWPTFNRMICSIIKKEVEERLGRHGEFGRASFSRLSLGKQAPLVLAVKGIPFAGDLAEGGALAMALDIQVEWDGQPDILIQLSGIPGASVAVQLCHVKGLLRVELSPIEDELPFLTGLSLTLLSNPELDFDIRALGGDLTSLPALGSWLKSAVAGIIQERLVWPQTLGWRWGPSWDRQRAAAAGGGAALAAGEAQRRRQLPAPLGVLLVEVVAADLEPRRSTFLGRLKPVSSRLSLLLPPAADPAGPGGAGRGSAAARAVVQKGLTSVQAKTCQPLWQQAFPFVVSSRHQVLHLLLSHKREIRGVPLVKGVVAALGADMPLGSADVAVADILSEAAAQEEWSVQQMLLEAAKLEVAAAAAAAAAAESEEESLGGYASADEGSNLPSPSPSMISTRSGSLGLGAFASAALAAAAAQDGEEEAAGGAGSSGRGWVRLERREGSTGLGMPPSAAALAAARKQQASWQQHARKGTPPPRSLAARLERRSGGSSGEGSPAPGRPLWAARQDDAGWQGSGRWRHLGATPPPPLRVSSWRRSATRSPSPDRGRMLGTAALLDPAALMQLQMEQRAPEMKWLSGDGVWVEVPSANVMTLAGLLAQAAAPASDATPDTPRSGGSEEDDGWMGRLRGYILGKGEGEEGDDEFIPTKAPLAGRVRLRLTWQPVEREPLPATLLEAGAGQEERHVQQQGAQPAAAAEQQQQQQQQQQQGRGHSRSGSQLLPASGGGEEAAPAAVRRSLQLPRGGGSGPEAAKSAPAALQTGQPPGGAADAGTPTQGGMAAAAAAAALAAAADSLTPQPGVLAVRVANTKLEYVTEMSCPVLAVSIERWPTLEQAEAAAPLAASPTKLPRSAPPSAAGSPAGAAVAAGAAAAVAGQAAAPASEAAAASTAAAAQQAQRWISMESTPGSRMGSLHWGQVFYIPAPLSPADCQEGRLLVELGEVASTTRYTLFGPALYALDASDSFSEDVTVVATAAVPLRRLLQQHRASLRAQLKEATPGVSEADRLVVGEADVQLGWFPLQQPQADEADPLEASVPA